MTRQSRHHNAALVAAYDFSPFHLVADIGGGQGSTLAAILAAHPSVNGILLDLPQVVATCPRWTRRRSPTGARSSAAKCSHPCPPMPTPT